MVMAGYCLEPGCGAIVSSGRCAVHARTADLARGSRHARGYDNRWARRSRLFRARFPICGMRPGLRPPVMSRCYDEDRVTLAAVVDHVVPHKGNRALFWDEVGNWQSLCAACHSRKSSAGL
jgi:5-methylcytosine-specific restriction enzyme A